MSWLRAGLDTGFAIALQGGRRMVRFVTNGPANPSPYFSPSVSIHAAATNPCVAQENGVRNRSHLLCSEQRDSGSCRTSGLKRGRRRLPPARVVLGDLPERGINRRDKAVPRTRRSALFLITMTLAGCAHQPLTRSCITQKQYEQLKNAEPSKVHDKLTGKADEDVRPLAGSALELRAWGHAMLDTLKICSTP